MYLPAMSMLSGCILIVSALDAQKPATPTSVPPEHPAAEQRINLGEQLTAGKLRMVNREASKIPERDGIHVSAKEGNGVVWVEGTDFRSGSIEVDIRGRDVPQQSFVGIAFHRKEDTAYEAVYLRPFNFRATDPTRHDHAIQYIALPDYDWPRLRKEFPEEFENPVDASLAPTEWVRLRVVVEGSTIQAFAGSVKTPTLSVRKLGQLDGGLIGVWVGNNSEGDFANLVVSRTK